MYHTINTMKCYNKNQELQDAHQVFQKGIMMSITSIKALRNEMEKNFGHKYLLTHRVNQDCLENFYSQMRYRNGASDHPSPVECLFNMKSIILGKNPGIAANMHTNTVDRDPEEYASANFQNCISKAVPAIRQSNTDEQCVEEFLFADSLDLKNSLKKIHLK